VVGPPAPDLRVTHYHKGGWDLYLLVNEGDELIERRVSLATTGALELWDPMNGSTRPWPATAAGERLETAIRVERRQGVVLAVAPEGTPDPDAKFPLVPGNVAAPVPGPWQASDADGNPINVPCPGDWAREREWEIFTGTLCFQTEFELTDDLAAASLFLDLGAVGDIADVRLNGTALGVRAWPPYVLPVGQACRPGTNTLEVRVTNSMANAIQGAQLPSGVLGPVCLRSGVDTLETHIS